jgi:hypothetical protein
MKLCGPIGEVGSQQATSLFRAMALNQPPNVGLDYNEKYPNLSRQVGQSLEMSVSDDGKGVPAMDVERTFFAAHLKMQALVLLRHRLQGLFGRSFQLEVHSNIGQGPR